MIKFNECKVCGLEVEPNPNTGRVGKWNKLKAEREGWFFQKDGTAYCSEHVPDWVEGWRARQQSKVTQSRTNITPMNKDTMTDEHKAALDLGRKQAVAVRAYLTFLNANRRVWQGRSAAELQKALAESTDPMERLRLRPQLRAALEVESAASVKVIASFIQYAAGYSERLGITYADWREEGVPAAVLRDAGIPRNRIDA